MQINNLISKGDLLKAATVANFATVQIDGGRAIERQIEHDNLDVIISVGYRVKFIQVTQFYIWATIKTQKNYILNQKRPILHSIDRFLLSKNYFAPVMYPPAN